jgi:hypothetical protein
MTTTKVSKAQIELKGFAVKMEKTIGFVDLGGHGSQSPIEAAFTLIAENGEGVFRFPSEAGGFIEVEVTYYDPKLKEFPND